MQLAYQNCTVRETPCDHMANREIKLLYGLYDEESKKQFQQFMLPDFNITNIQNKYFPPCEDNAQFAPSFSIAFIINTLTIYILGKSILPYPGMEELILPRSDLVSEFPDEKIRVELYYANNVQVPVTSWAFSWADTATNGYVLNIVLTDEAYDQADTNRQVQFDMRVIDEINRFSIYRIAFTLSIRPVSYYVVTFSFSNFNLQGTDVLVVHMTRFMKLLIQALGSYKGSSYETIINLKSFSFSSTSSTSGAITWALNVGDKCDYDLILETQSKMFVSITDKRIKSTFTDSLRSLLLLDSIREKYTKPCSLTPPTKSNELDTLQISFCGIFTYRIPENTFFDQEDGNTRQLRLSVTEENNVSLSSSSWLQFNSTSQVIYVLLPSDLSTQQRNYIYKLTATDSSGLQVTCDVRVLIVGDPKPASFRVTVRSLFVANQYTESTNPSHVISGRVGRWFNDEGRGFQLISHRITSNGEQLIEFTNCTWRTKPCDAIKVNDYRLSMFSSDDTVKDLFVNIFKPEFPNPIITGEVDGECKVNNRPTVPNPWGPLTITSCKTFRETVPPDTFSDVEQGNTRNLRLKLQITQANDLPYWSEFNADKQELTMVSSETMKPLEYVYLLSAFDIGDLSAVENLRVNIQVDSETPSHEVRMRVKSASLDSYVKIYERLREMVESFFRDETPTMSYITMSNYPSAEYEVRWTNCTVSRSTCEQDKINWIRNRLLKEDGGTNPSFLLSLQTEFTIEEILLNEAGICIEVKKPPVLVTPVEDQEISYCSYLRLTIPENTFSDNLEGNTRQLTLSMTFQNGSLIPGGYWLGFDPTTQEINAVLVSASPLEKNEYTFILTATNKRSLSVSTTIKFLIIGQPYPLKNYMRVLAKVNFVPTSASQVLTEFMDKIALIYPANVTNIHLYDASYQRDGFFVTQLINCNCTNEFIEKFEHTIDTFDTSKFGPEFTKLTLDIRRGEPCETVSPPKPLQPIPPFDVTRCESFSKVISNEAFEDSTGADHLIYTITSINGDVSEKWIRIDGRQIVGIVTNDVMANKPADRKYNITLRATNVYHLYGEVWFIVTLIGDLPQSFYKYDMVIKDNNLQTSSLDSGLWRQIEVSKRVTSYFQTDIMNLINYQSQSANQFLMQWSVCPLPDQCTVAGLSESASQIYTGDQIKSSFQEAFKSAFELVSITRNIAPECKKPINPPTAIEDPLTISGTYCGGIDYRIPEDLFNDPEDGNTRKLTLYFESSQGTSASVEYPWLYFNQETQVLKAMPTYDQARSLVFSGKTFQLTAKDSTGHITTISVKFSLVLPAPPKYWYTFVVTPMDESNVEMRFTFMDKIANFLGDTNRDSIGLRDVSPNRLDYFNCSIPMLPCDLYKFNQIKAKYSTPDDSPNNAIKNAMLPEFAVASISSNYIAPCGGPNPPKVNVTPPIIINTICGYHTYEIPEYTFYDLEDGPTRNLQLSMTVKSGSTFTMNSYVQFITSTQTALIMPKAQLLSTYGNEFEFSLTATDSSALSATTDVKLQINGPYSLLTECQIQVTLQKSSAFSSVSRTTVETMQFVINRLISYFNIAENEIGIVDFYSIGSNQFYFSWSYCSALYLQSSYQSNGADLNVDYVGLQAKILMNLYLYDRTTINPNFQSAFLSDFNVITVKTAFSGRCTNLPPISPSITEITISIGYGGYKFHSYQESYFYDFQEGWAYSLKITLLDSTKTKVMIDHWVNVDVTTYNIYAVVVDYIRFSSTTSYTYYLQAMDSIGQTAEIKVNIIKTNEILTFAPFNITYLLSYHGDVNLVYANQSSYIIHRLTTFFQSITTTNHVLVRWYYQSIGYLNFRVITWSVAGHTCSSDVLARVKSAYQASVSGKPDQALMSSVTDMFTLDRLYYHTTCPGPIVPPDPTKSLPFMNITFCSVFTYQIKPTLFFDDYNGETYAMELRLLTSSGHLVQSSSWIQLNPTTMQIYAVAIQSIMKTQSTYTYKLQAINSAGMASIVELNAAIINQPYTVDCKIQMSFRYNLMTATLADLDVIRMFITMVTSYYGDITTNIKILSFYRKIDNSFEIMWSNCSFQVDSFQTALSGFTEDMRNRITEIFSQIVMENGAIVSSFRQHLSSHFEIISLTVNYDCIEEPPVPMVTQHIIYAKFCESLNSSVPRDTFFDKRDGNTRNLKLRLTDKSGNPVSIDNWVQIDSQQNIYGIVTEKVKRENNGDYVYLLVATDSSGRSANITLTVKVTSPVQSFDTYFRTGFTNRFGNMEGKADILYYFVKRLSRHLDPGDSVGQIYLREFTYPSTVVWTHCSLQPCTPQRINNIMNKLVTSTGNSTEEFRNVMQPKVVPLSTRVNIVRPFVCTSSNITITVINPQPNVTVPSCGYFMYQISTTQFRDVLQRQTGLFYLNFYHQDGGLVAQSSWIRFNQTQQFIYGVPIISKLSKTTTFILQAKHQDSGMTSVATTTINIPNYEKTQTVSNKLCYITFNVTVKYSSGFDDVTILKFFMEILASYLNSRSEEIQIYSYERHSGYPFTMLITWTNCTLTNLFITNNYAREYYTQFSHVINSFLNSENNQYTTHTVEISKYFQTSSLLQINSIKQSSNCTRPPNPPPRKVRDLNITVRCGIFNYKIPEDTFQDEEGGTSQLSLTLKNFDESELAETTWIILNDGYSLIGMISNEIITAAVNSQYKFKLEATDSSGLSTTADVVVNVPTQTFPPVSIEVVLTVMYDATQSPYKIIPYLTLVDRLNKFLKSITLREVNLYFLSEEPFIIAQNIKVGSCERCSSRINNKLMVFHTYLDQVKPILQPEFNVISIDQESTSLCATVYPEGGIISEYVPYCGHWVYNMTTIETDVVYLFTIVFKDENGNKLPTNSWIWYTNYTLEAYPPPSFWENPDVIEMTYIYDLIYENEIASSRKIRIGLNKTVIATDAIDFKIELSTGKPRDPNQYDNFYISTVMNALIRLVGSGKGLHFVSFTVTNQDPFSFKVKWQNCSLPTSCNSTDIDDVNSILYERDTLSNLKIKTYLPAEYEIEDLSNRCKTQPTPTAGSLNLSVPVCGLFKHKLDPNIATDNKGNDIDAFVVTLLQSDGSRLPRNSWIKYNDTTKEIYAFPTEAIASALQTYHFKLQFTDSTGGTSDTPVYVTVVNNDRLYYEASITFKSMIGTAIPYLDIQIRMLELISNFVNGHVNLQQYRVQLFEKTGTDSEFYYLKYGSCAVEKKLCEKDENTLKETESTMFNSDNDLQPRFQQFISKYFTGIKMRRESGAFDVDEPPAIVKKLDVVTLSRCQAVCVDYQYVCYDGKQDTDKLKYSLKSEDGHVVPLTHWTQITGDKICVYPPLSLQPGVYNFNITCEDKCGSQISTLLSVEIVSQYKEEFGYKWTLFTDIQKKDTEPDVYYLDIARKKMMSYLRNKLGDTYRMNKLQITDYTLQNDQLEISFGECSIQYKPCNHSAISRLALTLILTDNQPNPDLLKMYNDIITINEVDGSRKYPCGSTPGGPICDENKIVINASLCELLEHKLSDLCRDPEDGGMMQLSVQLKNINFRDLDLSSWIQFNKTSKTIYGYPKNPSEDTILPKRYNFVLEIKDSDGNRTVVDVCVDIIGSRLSSNYQLTMEGQLADTSASTPDVDYQICMIKKMGGYFQGYSINNIKFQRSAINTNPQEISFVWGFCEMRDKPCDCRMVKETQNVLKDLTKFSTELKSCLRMITVTYNLYGDCADTEKPRVENGISEVVVTVGQPYEVILPNNQFVDEEDGSNVNLTLQITDGNGNVVTDLEWLTLTNNTICGLMDYYDYQQSGYSTETTYTYYVTATDSCGKTATDEFLIKIRNDFPGLEYRIFIRFSFPFSRMLGNCSDITDLIQKIADYANVPKEEILVQQLSAWNDTVNGTYFIWGIRSFSAKNCDNKELQTFRELFIEDDRGNKKFVKYMTDNGYEISDLSDVFDERSQECHDLKFPWWIVILLALLLFLLLLLWLLWLLIPRCCPSFCASCCSGLCCLPACVKCCGTFCTKCCSKGGKYSSLPGDDVEKGMLVKSPIDEDEKPFIDTHGHENSAGSSTHSGDSVDHGVAPLPPDDSPDHGVIPGVRPPNVLPLPPIYDPFQTESWTDKREKNIYHRYTKHDGYGDEYTDGYGVDRHTDDRHHYDDKFHRTGQSSQHSKGSHHIYREGMQLVPLDHNVDDGYTKEVRYIYEPRHTGTYYEHEMDARHTGGLYHKGGYHHNRYEHGKYRYQHDGYMAGKHVRIKQPVMVRIRRSDLKEYLKSQGRNEGEKIKLRAGDIERLMKRNAKLSILKTKDRRNQYYRQGSNSRLADALVDRKLVRIDHKARKPHRRSYSTSSLSDVIMVDQAGKHVAISPRNVTFTMKGYESDYATTSTSSDSIHVGIRRNVGTRYVVPETISSRYVVPETTSSRYVVVPETTSSSSDFTPRATVLTSKNLRNRHNFHEIRQRGGRSHRKYELKQRSANVYSNKGYTYDHSEV